MSKKIISIFNLSPKSGKSTTAIFLAESLAILGKKVLVFDAHFNNHLAIKLNKSKQDISKISLYSWPWYLCPFKEEIDFNELEYDYILIDTPTGQLDICKKYLELSNSVILPIEAEFYGIKNLEESLRLIQNLEKNVLIEGFLFNRLVKNNKFANKIIERFKSHFEFSVFNTTIYRNFFLGSPIINKVKETIGQVGYSDYLTLANELVEREFLIKNNE